MTIAKLPAPSVRTMPAAPKELGAAGRALWTATLREYQFSTADEFATLKQLCLTHDRLAAVQDALRNEGLVVPSPQGARAHPLIAAESQLHRSLLSLRRGLGLN